MTDEQRAAFAIELAKPAYAAAKAAGNDAALADLLNTADGTRPVPGRFLTDVGVAGLLGVGAADALLAVLEGMADGSIEAPAPLTARIVGRIKGWLTDRSGATPGLDFGIQATQDMLGLLVESQPAFADAAAALVAYGRGPDSPALRILGRPIAADEVRWVR